MENLRSTTDFDKEYRFENLRLVLQEGGTLPSISAVYFGAFIYENEIHDLFGIMVTGMNIDFKGTLYLYDCQVSFQC